MMVYFRVVRSNPKDKRRYSQCSGMPQSRYQSRFAAGYAAETQSIGSRVGEAISITWLVGGIAASLAKVIYGEDGGGWAFTVSGLVNLFSKGWLLVYVLHFKTIAKWEKWMATFLGALVILMFFAPNAYASSVRFFGLGLTWKDLSMWLIGIGIFFAQKHELKQGGARGVFREALPLATSVSAGLMLAYCFHAGTSGPLVGYFAYIASQAVFIGENRRAHRVVNPV